MLLDHHGVCNYTLRIVSRQRTVFHLKFGFCASNVDTALTDEFNVVVNDYFDMVGKRLFILVFGHFYVDFLL